MKNQPFRTIVRSSQRLHIAAFLSVPIVLLLALALSWGVLRILNQEKEKISLDFFALTTYLGSQQRFLQDLHKRNRALPALPALSSPARSNTVPGLDGLPAAYLVHPSAADIPYTLFCFDQAACPHASDTDTAQSQIVRQLYPLGGYLSDFYATHWSRSYFPGTITILLDEHLAFGLMVPALDPNRDTAPYTEASVLTLIKAIHALTQQQAVLDAPHWLALPSLPNTISSVIDVSFAPGIWPASEGKTPRVYAITTFSLQLTNLFRNISEIPIYDGFWLQDQAGASLAGIGSAPGPYPEGIHWTPHGVVLTLMDASRTWTGIYQISYLTMLQANPRLPGIAVAALLLSLALVFTYVHWYNRRVIRPAQAEQQALIDSESFNRALLDTAPVALCVVTHGSGLVVFCNALAQQWLDLDGTTPHQALKPGLLPPDILHATAPGAHDSLALNGHFLQIVYAPTRYRKQAVVLCAFIDISARIQYEQALAHAKFEADSANTAKSRFLAAVSHEIRTPLYGILGTLELLQLTPLNDGQHQHLGRLQQSSDTLMQLIGDVLDFTKAEAKQLALNNKSLDPRLLVQSCADHFAAAAHGKNLLLFACVETNTPACVLGDTHRIRQIINNLLSNALKFTTSGQVIVRLRSKPSGDHASTLTFQVVDSGVGISKNDQKKLFTPFFQVADATHMSQGTGLGLSICASLAELMGGRIDVTSEQGLGSSFALSVTLQHATEDRLHTTRPDLSGLHILIRSPHAEMSDNLCQWLRRWGAQATPVITAVPDNPDPDDILVDVLAESPARPEHWSAHYLSAGLAVPSNTKEENAPYAIEGYSANTLARGILNHLHLQQRPDTPPAKKAKKNQLSPLGLHLLVAEDNPINLAMLHDQLAQLGCTTVLTRDGHEALSHWAPNTFDAVLTDVNMPNMNGYEFTRALRHAGVDVPIIGVTANAMRDEEDKCKAAGMSAWLVKPINLQTLHHCLTDLVPTPLVAAPYMDQAPFSDIRGNASASAIDTETQPTSLHQATEDLALLPERYRSLFRETMLADAQALKQAALDKNELALRNALHRMQGALLTMKQQTFAMRVQNAQDMQHNGALGPACKAALDIAEDLEILITRNLSS